MEKETIILLCLFVMAGAFCITSLMRLYLPNHLKSKKMVAGTWWQSKNETYRLYVIGRKGKKVVSAFLLEMPWGNILSDEIQEDDAFLLAAVTHQIPEPENYTVIKK